MKVMYVVTMGDAGGAQKYVLTMAEYFGGIVVCGEEKERLKKEAEEKGVQVIYSKHLKRNIILFDDILAIFELKKIIKKYSPDIVHLNSSKAGLVGALAAKLAGIKTVFTAHGFRHFESGNYISKYFFIFLEQISALFQDFIIAVSPRDAEFAEKIKEKDNVSFIPNGIGQTDFLSKELAREELGLRPDQLVVGTVAGLYKTKGIDLLIEAAKEFENENIIFVVLGSGPEEKNLRKQLGKTNRNFILAGYVPEGCKYMKAFDVFVLPSRKEGFPYALLEAMQAGLPIITTNVGANSYALGELGEIVEPGSVSALSKALSRVIVNVRRGDNQRDKLQERALDFTEENMINQTLLVYKKMNGEKNA